MAIPNPALPASAGTVVSGDITLPWEPYPPWVEALVPSMMSQVVYDLGSNPYPNLRDIPECDPAEWWMGRHDLPMRCFTPEKLRELGIINISPMPPVSRRFLVDQAALQSAFDVRINCPKPFGNNTGIHPLFKSVNWYDTSPRDYELIKPALRIASEMLKMDVALDFLWTLGQPWYPTPSNAKTRQEYSATSPIIFKIFPGKSTAQDRIKTAQELVTWQNSIAFFWTYVIPIDTDAMTCRQDVTPGLRPKGRGSLVSINERSRDLLEGTERASYYNPTANDDSAVMRGHLHLAVTIVHEIAHAFKIATSDETRFSRVYPYCNDQRVAENGFSLELVVMGDSNRVIHKNGGNPYNPIMPFGLSSSRWPGAQNFQGSNYPSNATAAKYGVKHAAYYGLPMTWVHQFFTDEFWDNEVERFGAPALAMPMPFGIRHAYRGPGDYAPGKSPTVKTRWSSGQQKRVEDPENHSPDGLHPAVRDGVLFPDRAFDLDGFELNVKTAKRLNKVQKKLARTKRLIKQQKARMKKKVEKFLGKK